MEQFSGALRRSHPSTDPVLVDLGNQRGKPNSRRLIPVHFGPLRMTPSRSKSELSGVNKPHKPLMQQQGWSLDISSITVGHRQVQIQCSGTYEGYKFHEKPLSDSELRGLKAGAKHKVASGQDSLSCSFGIRRGGSRQIIIASTHFPPDRSVQQVETQSNLNSRVLTNRPLMQHGKSRKTSETRAGRQAETPEN